MLVYEQEMSRLGILKFDSDSKKKIASEQFSLYSLS